MKLLVIGSGAREHALVWKLAAEADVRDVLCAPGNAGITRLARTLPIDAGDVEGLLQAAERERAALTVVGPELPLDRGIVDRFQARGLRILGPSRAAARLECSKVFAKAFMVRHGVPTARYRACDTVEEARAIAASGELGFPLVVKADGLAAGKGVVLAADREAAESAITAAMEARRFGDAGARLVLEECLSGPEVSFFALCDGRRAVPLGSAQDHKRIFDGDLGPNTGGMGAFAPSPLVDAALQDQIMREIVDPVLRGMRSEGHEYRGFLYAGLMLTCSGPRVIEFNVRLGDPEAQVLIPLFDGDLAPALLAAADGALDRLSSPLPHVRRQVAVGVVLASAGYPDAVRTGLPVTGLDTPSDALIFHAGTALDGETVVTAGGRVLTVVGRGAEYEDAIARAYDGIGAIGFDGMQFRRDIGQKALAASR
jgi:phosphoribosylamine---glycine ligase